MRSTFDVRLTPLALSLLFALMALPIAAADGSGDSRNVPLPELAASPGDWAGELVRTGGIVAEIGKEGTSVLIEAEEASAWVRWSSPTEDVNEDRIGTALTITAVVVVSRNGSLVLELDDSENRAAAICWGCCWDYPYYC